MGITSPAMTGTQQTKTEWCANRAPWNFKRSRKMSKEVATTIADEIVKLEKPFKAQNAYNLRFESECLFAKQQITKNEFTLKTATNNPASLRNAILNVAAIGISLNPATAHAYLVPRDSMICLDISYRGLVKLATDAGAIEWAKSELVYEGDEFTYNGPCTAPTHKADPFSKERTFDKIIGAYCIAKLTQGDYLIETMSKAEIDKIRATSKASNGPWKTWPEEMAKKSITKRASKSWPPSAGKDRIDHAVEILNQHEGLQEYTAPSVSDYINASVEQRKEFHERLAKDSPVNFFVWWSSMDAEMQISLYNDFQQGEKGKGKQLVKQKEDQGRGVFWDIITAISETDDEAVIQECVEGLSEAAVESVCSGLTDDKAAIVREAVAQLRAS
jgi:recombination protein RecT